MCIMEPIIVSKEINLLYKLYNTIDINSVIADSQRHRGGIFVRINTFSNIGIKAFTFNSNMKPTAITNYGIPDIVILPITDQQFEKLIEEGATKYSDFRILNENDIEKFRESLTKTHNMIIEFLISLTK